MNKILRTVSFAAICMVALQPAAMSAVESKSSKPWLAQRVFSWAGRCVKNYWKPALATTAVAGLVGYWQRYSIFGYFDISCCGYTVNQCIDKTVSADYIEFLLKRYGQPAEKRSIGADRDSDLALCLCSAAVNGRLDLVKLLVKKLKAPLNEKCAEATVFPNYVPNIFGCTMQKDIAHESYSPIRFAIDAHKFEIARYLRDNKASIDYQDVATCQDTAFLNDFLKNLKLSEPYSKGENPIFKVVCFAEGAPLLEAIIAAGDETIIEAKDKLGQTPLWHAVKKSRLWAVKVLVESGAEISEELISAANDQDIKDYLDFVKKFEAKVGFAAKKELLKNYTRVAWSKRRKLIAGIVYRANTVEKLDTIYRLLKEVDINIPGNDGEDIAWVYFNKLKKSTPKNSNAGILL